jgi:hypothetical protein
MSNLSGTPPGNLSAGSAADQLQAEGLAARARLLMIVSAVTTFVAIAAILGVIGYRIFATADGGGSGMGSVGDGTIVLPKGARVISTSASAGRVAVLLDIAGATEIRIFDIKTFKQAGRLRFTTAP